VPGEPRNLEAIWLKSEATTFVDSGGRLLSTSSGTLKRPVRLKALPYRPIQKSGWIRAISSRGGDLTHFLSSLPIIADISPITLSPS